eukprot:1533189-Pyramimonas_sp.AAC.1
MLDLSPCSPSPARVRPLRAGQSREERGDILGARANPLRRAHLWRGDAEQHEARLEVRGRLRNGPEPREGRVAPRG